MYKSETEKYRDKFIPFCKGNGLDLGFGGDKIIKSAIGIDLKQPYAHTGNDDINLAGDATNLYWFKDEVLDYIYSSHLLEDFVNTAEILKEWTRVLKIGGHLCLLLPDQQRYEKITTQLNLNHKIADMGLNYIKKTIHQNINNLEIVYCFDDITEYNFGVVYRKLTL